MRESQLEQKLVNAVSRIGGAAPKWVSPGNTGVPDRIVILPGGKTAFVEMKAPGKALAPMQKEWAAKLESLGHKVYKIDSLAGIDSFIADCKRGDAE